MPGYKSKKLMAEMKVTDYEAAFRKLVDKWHESVRHYEERIEVLEAANLKQSCIKVDDQMRIEKLETALLSIRVYGNDTMSGPADGSEDNRNWYRGAVIVMKNRARKALEEKDD